MSSISNGTEGAGEYCSKLAKRALSMLLSKESTVHAVLLYGIPGPEKSDLARWLSRAWLCKSPTAEGGCGQCAPCAAFARSAAADFFEVEPTGPGAQIKVGAITPDKGTPDKETLSIQEFLRTPPLAARHKVVWVKEAERFSSRAANAFLKTLEEPDGYARFVLTTANVGDVPATVRSRCVLVPCDLPDEEELEELTGGLRDWERTLSLGSPGLLERIRRAPEPFERIRAFADSLEGRPRDEAVAAAEELRAIAESLAEAMELSARSGLAETLEALARFLAREERAPASAKKVLEAHRRVLGNAHSGLVADALLADLLSSPRENAT